MIRIVIVDDHEMVRYGLRILFEASDEFELVGEAATGEEAVRLCVALKPDVVLMDVLMPGIDGVEATRQIRRALPKTQVVLLSSIRDHSTARAADEAGATTYLPKTTPIEQLTEALKAAARSHNAL